MSDMAAPTRRTAHARPPRAAATAVPMAAPLALRLAPRLGPAPRRMHLGPPRPALGRWREGLGLAPGPQGYGPLRDLPDWSFVDGRPAPPWKGQIRRQQEDEAFARRVAMLSGELERGRQRWQDQQRQQQEATESKKRNRLQPKGGAPRRPPPQ